MTFSTHLVVDIETIPDPDLPLPEPRKDAPVARLCDPPPPPFPAPPHHKIVCVGYAWLTGYRVASSVPWGSLAHPRDSEADILRQLVKALADEDPVFVGFNSRSFDLPVIASRCLVHGIPFPWYYDAPTVRRSARYRYSEARHLDLCDVLSDHGAAPRAQLDTWARAVGFPGKKVAAKGRKEGLTGADVATLYAAGRHGENEDYCVRDVAQTVAVLLRAQLLRGVLPLEGDYGYLDCASRLLDAIAESDRTRPLVAGIDRNRFLLHHEPTEI